MTASYPLSLFYKVHAAVNSISNNHFPVFAIFRKKATMKVSIVILLLTLFFSCRKDDNDSSLYQTWEVKEFMSIESVAYLKNENTKFLQTFNKTGSYGLKLDINNCGVNYSTVKNNQLEIGSTACTEACCDSKFAEKVAAMLSRVTSYEISGKTLKLNVPQWGYIELELSE